MQNSRSMQSVTEKPSCMVLRDMGYISGIVAVAISFLLSCPAGSFEIRQPVILLTAAIFAVFILKKAPSLIVFQNIITIYLVSLRMSLLSEHFIKFSPLGSTFLVPKSLIPLVLLAVAAAFMKLSSLKAEISEEHGLPLSAWAIALSLIAVTMLFLGLLLHKSYGYGYEHDIAVLLKLALYFMVFLFISPCLVNIRFRQLASICCAAHYIYVMAALN